MGASLLAIAVAQSASMLNVPAPSRAGSLPHLICGCPRFFGHCKSLVGASLLAIAVGQSASMLNVPRLRGQARSHI
ncbi:hypothetical protein EAH72_16810 [Pseudomonas caspiana]|nr:hypothetical protein EAH72_16810 [Pseudomonas caspiana]